MFLDRATELRARMGKGAELVKEDIKSAFRLKFDGKHYVLDATYWH